MTTATTSVVRAGHRVRPPVDAAPVVVPWVLLGALLSIDNFPPTYRLVGLTSGSLALPILLFLVIRYRRPTTPTERRYWWLVVGLLTTSFVSVVGSMFQIGSTTDVMSLGIGSDLAVTKALTTTLIVFAWLSVIALGIRLAQQHMRAIVLMGYGLLVVSVVLLLAERVGLIDASGLDALHAVQWHEGRPRGLKFESSVFGSSIIAAGAMVAFGLSRRRTLWALVPVVCLAAWTSTSRGAFAAVVGGLVFAAVIGVVGHAPGRLAVWLRYVLTAVCVSWLSLFPQVFVASSFWAPIARAASDATRSGWGAAAVSVLTTPPFGLNVFSYWFEIQPHLERAYISATEVYMDASLGELAGLTSQATDSGLTPKTVPGLFAVWYGWPGLAFVIVALCIAVDRAGRYAARVDSGALIGVSMVVVSLATVVPGIFVYETALVVGCGLGCWSATRKQQGPAGARAGGSRPAVRDGRSRRHLVSARPGGQTHGLREEV